MKNFNLVTGADGFIGSHLVEELLKRKKKVRAIVQYNSFNSYGWLENIQNKNLEIILGDVRSSDFVNSVMKGCEKIFHLAALISIPYSYRTPQSYFDTNVNGTMNILESAKNNKVKKILITSTSEVYGTAIYTPIDEKHQLQGQSPYSASKISADKLSEAYALSYDLPIIIARPFNNFGPRQSNRAIIPTIINQLLKSDKIKLGNLKSVRDFVFVTDTVQAMIKLSDSKFKKGEVFNICSGRKIRIYELAKKISKILRKELYIKIDKQRIRPKNSEVNKLIGCNKKIKKLIKWTIKVNFDQGLKKTCEWYLDRENRKLFSKTDYTI